MKKQEKKATADEMYDAAARRTEESRDDGYYACQEAWSALIGSYHGEKNDYAEKGVFLDARDYFVARERDIRKGWYATNHFAMRREVKKILSFNFNFDYDSFSWNEQTYDPEDDSAFDYCSEMKPRITRIARIISGALPQTPIHCGTASQFVKFV